MWAQPTCTMGQQCSSRKGAGLGMGVGSAQGSLWGFSRA